MGDLNLFNANDPKDRLYTGKTRALIGTHVGLQLSFQFLLFPAHRHDHYR
ncbi:hypothetical protein [Mesorhizobium sp. M0571]